MNCKKTEELIFTDYVDGNLKGHALEELKAHLGSCPNCRKLAEELESTGKLFKASPRKKAPAGLWYKICAEISERPVGGRIIEGILENVRYHLSRLRPAVVILSTAVIILFILTAVMFMSQNNYSKTGISQDDILGLYYMNGASDESEYDFGTPAERFFL
jgi:predicted anti-sigma-YlaC factor YlaD